MNTQDIPVSKKDIPWLTKLEMSDLETVEVNGVKYKDITPLLFFDTMHKKTYLDKEEYEKSKCREAKKIRDKIKNSKEVKQTLDELYNHVITEKEAIMRLEQLSYTENQIAIVMNKSLKEINAVIKEIKKRQIVHRSMPDKSIKEIDDFILKLRDEGVTRREIAKKLNVTTPAVDTRIHQLKRIIDAGKVYETLSDADKKIIYEAYKKWGMGLRVEREVESKISRKINVRRTIEYCVREGIFEQVEVGQAFIDVKELYEQGLPIKEISKQLGIKSNVVSSMIIQLREKVI